MQGPLPPRLQLLMPGQQHSQHGPATPINHHATAPAFFASPADYKSLPFTQAQAGGAAPPSPTVGTGLGVGSGATYQPYYPTTSFNSTPYNGGGAPMLPQASASSSGTPQMVRSTSAASSSSSLASTPGPSSNYFSPSLPPHQYAYATPPNYNQHAHSAGTPPSPFGPPSSLPFRRTSLHASTPSFHPTNQFSRHQRPGSISLRPPGGPPPLRSPTLSRANSLSPGPLPSGNASSTGVKEERKRKVKVAVPLEADSSSNSEQAEGDGRKRSTITRTPLEESVKRRRIEDMDRDATGEVMLEEDELVSRAMHYDEERVTGLPDTIDVYLPGQAAWDDMKQPLHEELFDHFGIPLPSSLNPFSARFNSFLDFTSSTRTTPSPGSHQAHFRTGSLFAAPTKFPPRLQTALDQFTRGHATAQSLGGGPLNPLTKTFLPSMPGWARDRLASAASVPLPQSPGIGNGLTPSFFPSPSPLSTPAPIEEKDEEEDLPLHAPTPLKTLTLAELGRGFGLGLGSDDEEGADSKLAEDGDAADDLRPHVGPPSRRMSRESTKTGVASLSDEMLSADSDDQSGEEIVTNPFDEERRAAFRQQHLHRGSLGTEALEARRRGRPVGLGIRHGDEENEYDASEDGEGDELSEDEYSNPSEEERAKVRAEVRSRTREILRKEVDSQQRLAVPKSPDDHILFEAPSDIDRSPVVADAPAPPSQPLIEAVVASASAEKGAHRVTANFQFPPPTPPRPTTASGTLVDANAAEVAPVATVSRSASLNVDAPEFVFGQTPSAAPKKTILTISPTFGRHSSANSLGSTFFADGGRPGSLAGDSPALSPAPELTPSPPPASALSISPFAPVFVPTNPDPPSAQPSPEEELLRGEAEVEPTGPDVPSSVSPVSLPSTAPTLHRKTSRGPLPPIPLTTVASSNANAKRLKVDSDSSTTSLAGRGPLPIPPLPQEEQDLPKDQDHSLVSNGNASESDGPSSNLGRSFTASGRPFTLRPTPTIVTDSRILGLGPPRRPAIPSFNSEPGSSNSSKDLQLDANERKMSLDDIALPSIYRPKSKAIAILPSPGDVKIDEDAEDDNIFGSDAMPLTPLSASPSGSATPSDDALDSDDDDRPLRLLEDLISAQFDGLRHELSTMTALKSDFDELKREALLDRMVARMGELLSEEKDSLVTHLRENREEGEQKLSEKFVMAVKSELEKALAATRQNEESVSKQDLEDVVKVALDPFREALLEDQGRDGPTDKLEQAIGAIEQATKDVSAALSTHVTEAAPTISSNTLDSKPIICQLLPHLDAQQQSTAQLFASQVAPQLDQLVQHAQVDQVAAITSSIAKRLLPSLVPLPSTSSPALDIDNLVARLAQTSNTDGVSTTMASFKIEMRSMLEKTRDDVAVELKSFGAKLQEPASDKVAELEAQLARARNDHGKARSERAALQDRLEAERSRFTTELEELKKETRTREEENRASEFDKALLRQTVDRLEAECEASKKALAQLGAKDVQIRGLEATVEASRKEVEVAQKETSRVQGELVELRTTHEGLTMAKDEVESERQGEREKIARLEGVVSTLEKRLEAQDDKITNLQRLKASQQQALALANQRGVDLKKRVADYDTIQSQLAHSLSASTGLEHRAVESESARAKAVAELADFKDKMAHNLEKMRLAMASELEEAASRLQVVEEAKERLEEEKRIVEEQKDALAQASKLHLEVQARLVADKARLEADNHDLLRTIQRHELQSATFGQHSPRRTLTPSAHQHDYFHSTPPHPPATQALYPPVRPALSRDVSSSSVYAPDSTLGWVQHLRQGQVQGQGHQPPAPIGQGRPRAQSQAASSDAGSEGTIHEGVSHVAVSPTPSVSGKSISVDDSGWWSSS